MYGILKKIHVFYKENHELVKQISHELFHDDEVAFESCLPTS